MNANQMKHAANLAEWKQHIMAEHLMESAEKWMSAMEAKAIVDPLPNGKMKRYEFSDEQIERMKKIASSAGGVYASLQEK